MLTFAEAQKQFIGLFGQTARYHHRYKVFTDFVQCGAIAIHNRFYPEEELGKQYQTIIKGYEREEVDRLAQLLTPLQIALNGDIPAYSHLGSVSPRAFESAP